jgi:hypothetical protein
MALTREQAMSRQRQQLMREAPDQAEENRRLLEPAKRSRLSPPRSMCFEAPGV